MGLLNNFDPSLLGLTILANNNSPNLMQTLGRSGLLYAQNQAAMQEAQKAQEWEQVQRAQMQKQWEQQEADRQAIHKATGGIPFDVYKFQNPQTKPTKEMINYNAINNPAYGEKFNRHLINQKKAGSTNITIGDKLRNADEQIAYDNKMSVADANRKYVQEVFDVGNNVYTDLANLKRGMKLLDSGIETGFGKNFEIGAKQLLNRFGVDTKNLAGEEELRKILGDQVMARIAQTKGAISNKEMELFQRWSANIGNTPEGNKAILNFQINALERAKTLTNKIRQWRKQGVSESDIEEKISHFRESNPLSTPEQNQIQALDGINDWRSTKNIDSGGFKVPEGFRVRIK